MKKYFILSVLFSLIIACAIRQNEPQRNGDQTIYIYVDDHDIIHMNGENYSLNAFEESAKRGDFIAEAKPYIYVNYHASHGVAKQLTKIASQHFNIGYLQVSLPEGKVPERFKNIE